MAQLINEAKRFQKLAGILKESPNMAFNQIALDYSNTNPNTPPGATAGEKLNEFKYKNNTFGNVNGHGRIDFSRMLTDDEVEKFAEKLGHSADKIYLDRDGREHYADGQYYEYTTIIDPTAPNAGGKTSEEMKKIASELNLKESLDIDAVVNEALAKVRKKEQTNELFGFGAPTLKVGDMIELEYDKPLATMGNGDDRSKLKAELIALPNTFEITDYDYNADDYKSYFPIRGGTASLDKNPSSIANRTSDAYVARGENVRIYTGDSDDKVIATGQKLNAGGSSNSIVTKIKLNGKEVKKVKFK